MKFRHRQRPIERLGATAGDAAGAVAEVIGSRVKGAGDAVVPALTAVSQQVPEVAGRIATQIQPVADSVQKRAAEVVARALPRIFRNDDAAGELVTLLCLGGPHFEPSFRDAALGTGRPFGLATGHILPNQWIVGGEYEEGNGLDMLRAAAQSIKGGIAAIVFHDNLKGPLKALGRALGEELGVPALKHQRLRNPEDFLREVRALERRSGLFICLPSLGSRNQATRGSVLTVRCPQADISGGEKQVLFHAILQMGAARVAPAPDGLPPPLSMEDRLVRSDRVGGFRDGPGCPGKPSAGAKTRPQAESSGHRHVSCDGMPQKQRNPRCR